MNTTNAPVPARTDNCVFPTPWTYQIELHSDDETESAVAITDFSGDEFAIYEGDIEGAHAFIESAHVMEESHQLLAAAKHYLTTLGGMSPADFANGKDRPQREELEGVIADAERA